VGACLVPACGPLVSGSVVIKVAASRIGGILWVMEFAHDDDFDFSVDGKVHTITAGEISVHLTGDIAVAQLGPLAEDFESEVQRAVARLRRDPSDDDGGTEERGFLAEERGYLEDEELQMLAAVNVAQRVLAERDYEDAETRHVLDPGDLSAEQEFARAAAALAEARSAASAALARWLHRSTQRKRQERFAGIVANRRRELGLSREQLAAACGLSSSTIKNLETPSGALREWNNKTKSAIEEVFSWPSGSFDDVLERGDSAPQPRASQAGPHTRAESLKILRLEASVYDAVEEVAILESRNINDVIDDAIDLYRRIKGPRSVGD